MQLRDVLALGNVGPEAALKRGKPVGIVGVSLVLHAAGEGVNDGHGGFGVAQKIVQDPSG